MKQELAPWQRVRLQVIEQLLLNKLSPDEIAQKEGISRRKVFYLKKQVVEEGVASLLERGKSPGRPPTLKGTRRKEFEAKVKRGTFENTAQAQAWIERRTGKLLTRRAVTQMVSRFQ